jgi:hypothetical protein
MEYLSLFDYLGKPAGGDLGKEVATEAAKQKIEVKTREVSTPSYTGAVNMYPKDFLEFYFRKPDSIDEEGTQWEVLDDDELPF